MAITTSHAFSAVKHLGGVSLPSPVALFAESLCIYARRFFSFLLILGIPTLLLFVLFVGVFGMADAEASRLTPGILFSPAVFLGVVLFGVLVLLLQVWGGVALLYAVTSDNAEPFWVSYAKSFSKIGSYLWILILFYFAGLAGLAFFIFPGIYFLISMSFALFVFFDEEVKGTSALARSFSYVKGNWWGVFFRVAFAFLVGAAFLFVCRSFFSLFLSVSSAGIVLKFISWLFLYPLGFLYLFRLFTAIRIRKSWVQEGLIHDHVFILVSFLGFVIFVTAPFLTLRGASRFVPTFYTNILDARNLFAISFPSEKTAVRSGPRGEELLALQASRDEKRLSDISTFVFVFDSVASKRASFCEGKDGEISKSTTPSGGGTNWLPVDLGREGIEGPVVTHTPRDPVNTSRYYYSFACSNKGTYEVNVRLESLENVSKAFSDGGSDEEVYEVGSDLSLIP